MEVLFEVENAGVGGVWDGMRAVEIKIFAVFRLSELNHLPDDEDGGVHFVKSWVGAAI